MHSVLSGLKVLWSKISWSTTGVEDLSIMSRTVTPKQMPKMAASKGKPATKKSSGKPKEKSKCKSGNGGGKGSDSVSSAAIGSSMTRSDSPLSSEMREEIGLKFPLPKTSDTSRTLPRFYAVLNRTEDEGVMMEDLDQLQMDLESLLSKVAVRRRLLQNEILAMNSSDNLDRGKASSPGKKGRSRGSKLVENLTKTRDVARSSSSKHSKKLYRLAPLAGTVPVVPPDNEPKPPAPKVFVSKNSAPNRFWASVDPYCSEVTQEHIKVLEDLIHHNQSSLQTLLETPPLGEHYSVNWALQELVEAQEAASMNRQRRKHAPLPNSQEAANLLKRSSRFGFEKQPSLAGPGPFANRLLAALIQENPVTPLHESTECNKVKVKLENEEDDPSSAKRIKLEIPGDKMLKERVRASGPNKSVGGENIVPYKPHVIACFERSLRLQLEAQGLLDPPDIKKEEEEDSVLSELHRCQEELQTLAQENERQLHAMIKLLKDEMVRQDLRKKLKHQDNEVVETYRKIIAAKQKRKPLTKIERDAAWKAVRDREILVKSLDALERK